MKRVYLDAAAAMPVSAAAKQAFERALKAYGNPSSAHQEGREASAILEEARKAIALEAGMKAEQVYFTGSATEANNLAITGFAKLAPKGSHFLYMQGAHASVVEPMRALAGWGYGVDEIPVAGGEVDCIKLKELLTPQTVLVSLEAASSETGVRFDTRKVRQLLDETGRKIAMHVDASQLPCLESFDRTRLGADMITLDAQKVGGVRGIGALLVSASTSLSPVIVGGGQERGLRSGTPAPALAAAFAAALLEAKRTREDFSERSCKLRANLLARIAGIRDVRVHEGKKQLPHIVSISLAGRDTDYLVALLDEDGFAVSTRSSCETDSEEGSRAVFAHTKDAGLARATLRISWGPKVHAGDLERFAGALVRRVAFLDQHS